MLILKKQSSQKFESTDVTYLHFSEKINCAVLDIKFLNKY